MKKLKTSKRAIRANQLWKISSYFISQISSQETSSFSEQALKAMNFQKLCGYFVD